MLSVRKKNYSRSAPIPYCFSTRAHTRNMAKQGKLEHVLDDKSPGDRLRDAGYKFAVAGENIARFSNQAKAESVMKTWMESKVHRENILNPDVTEIGLGQASDNKGQIYYTQEFAKPR